MSTSFVIGNSGRSRSSGITIRLQRTDESRWWCYQGYWRSLNGNVINAIACVGNAIACITYVTRYIGIVATYIAIVTTNMTNAICYIGIATGQVKGVSVKWFVAKGALRNRSNVLPE